MGNQVHSATAGDLPVRVLDLMNIRKSKVRKPGTHSRLGRFILAIYRWIYVGLIHPLLFRGSAQEGHDRAIQLMRRLDGSRAAVAGMRALHRTVFVQQPVDVGGVRLSYPLIVAAGWVKGDGFQSEEAAVDAVRVGSNVIPGWRSLPALVGPVEFGSFTRWPRIGNPGVVLWRDPATRSTQNRVGLRNPGAIPAAEFLAMHRADLPSSFGINIAVSPGGTDPQESAREVLEALNAFIQHDIRPSWFTLNLSCPNTEDDPLGNQSEELARLLCGGMIDTLRCAGWDTPLWVKLGHGLSREQISVLMRTFAEVGVRAVVATNTLPSPSPDNPTLTAGVGGGGLHNYAVEVVRCLVEEKRRWGYPIDIIGCGGVQSAETLRNFTRYGVTVVQYFSALIYGGPLAVAGIVGGSDGS